jgi:hypothetical protein
VKNSFKGLPLVSSGQFGHLNILLYSEEKARTDFQRFGVKGCKLSCEEIVILLEQWLEHHRQYQVSNIL